MARCGHAAAKPREIVKEGVSRVLPLHRRGPRHDSQRLGEAVAVVQRRRSADGQLLQVRARTLGRPGRSGYYQFKNDKDSKLGNEPLPDGAVMALRTVSADNLYAFVGRTSVKYIPISEQVEMELGNDREVMVKPKLMDWQKTDIRFDQWGNIAGWTIKETWQFEVQNSKDIDVVLDIRRNFPGDWDLKTDAKYEKVDATQGEVRPAAQEPRETEVHATN